MTFTTVAELAKECGVTPQGINAYLRKSGLQAQAVKNGNKFLINENLAETIRNHFGVSTLENVESETGTETEAEKTETNTETTETVSETTETDKTAGKEPDLSEIVKQLETRLQERESEVTFLRKQIESQSKTIDALTANLGKVTEQNQALILENAAFASRMLGAPKEEEIIDVEADLQNAEEPAESVEEPKQEERPQGFFEWIKSLFS